MKLFALLALFCAPVFAQSISQLSSGSGPPNSFIVITGAGFTGATQVSIGAVTNGVFAVKDDNTIMYTIPFQAPVGIGAINVKVGTKTATGPLNYTVTALPAYTIPVNGTPRCILNQQFSNWHMGVSAGGSPVYLLFCDDQIGLAAWGISGPPKMSQLVISPACQAQLDAFSWTLQWLQTAYPLCIISALNSDQQAEFDALWIQWVPRLTVAAGSNQNVYTQKSDGTKGPQLVIGGFGMQVPSKTLCGGNRLLNAGARYAEVSGQKTTNGVILPAASFALCDITYPPSGGFTN